MGHEVGEINEKYNWKNNYGASREDMVVSKTETHGYSSAKPTVTT